MANKYHKTKPGEIKYRKAPDWKWVIDSFSENKKAERRAKVRDAEKNKKKKKKGY